MHISQITVYPIKSCLGHDLDRWNLSRRGLSFDREWMVIDENNEMLTQRTHPVLSQITVAPTAAGFRVLIKDKEFDLVELPKGKSQQVMCWSDLCEGFDCGDAIASILSELMGLTVRLVRMAERFERPVDIPSGTSNQLDATASFADGYPLLIIGQGSLDDLNQRLEKPLPMQRFRPNLVIEGSDPFAEDSWRQIQIGDHVIDVVKPCARCVFTCVDQVTGKCGVEPLKTLATYRKFNNEIHFGINAIHHAQGTIGVGDKVSVLK